jgi:hypothetical protein
LQGWQLDDLPEAGSNPYRIAGVTIAPGSFVAFFRTQTHIALNDSGDTVRLLAPNGHVVDEIRYLRVRAYNLSFGRLPDGSGRLVYGLWPTPRRPNLLFEEPTPPASPLPFVGCAGDLAVEPRLPRLWRHPAALRWMASLGLAVCR